LTRWNRYGGGTLIVKTARDRGWVIVLFSDSGPGIKEPHRVFDPFYTNEACRQGPASLEHLLRYRPGHAGRILCYNRQEAAPCSALNCPACWRRSHRAKRNSAARAPQKSLPEVLTALWYVLDVALRVGDASRARVFLTQRLPGALMSDAAILTETHSKIRRTHRCRNVDLRVAAGQFFGFLGRTARENPPRFKMLTGLLTPTAGRMQLLGIDFSRHPVEINTPNRRRGRKGWAV